MRVVVVVVVGAEKNRSACSPRGRGRSAGGASLAGQRGERTSACALPATACACLRARLRSRAAEPSRPVRPVGASLPPEPLLSLLFYFSFFSPPPPFFFTFFPLLLPPKLFFFFFFFFARRALGGERQEPKRSGGRRGRGDGEGAAGVCAGRRGRSSPGPTSDHVPGLPRELRHLLQRQQRLPGTSRDLLQRRSPAGRAGRCPSLPRSHRGLLRALPAREFTATPGARRFLRGEGAGARRRGAVRGGAGCPRPPSRRSWRGAAAFPPSFPPCLPRSECRDPSGRDLARSSPPVGAGGAHPGPGVSWEAAGCLRRPGPR